MEAKIFLLLLIFTMDTVSGVEQEKMPIQYKVLFPYRALKTPVSPQQLNNLTTTVLTNGGEQLFRQIVQHPCCIDKINDPDCIHCNLATGVCCDKISHVQEAFGPEDHPMVQPQGPIGGGQLVEQIRPGEHICCMDDPTNRDCQRCNLFTLICCDTNPPSLNEGGSLVRQIHQPPCCIDKINDPDCIHCNLATGECCNEISRVQQVFGPENATTMPPQDPILNKGGELVRQIHQPPCCIDKINDPDCIHCNFATGECCDQMVQPQGPFYGGPPGMQTSEDYFSKRKMNTFGQIVEHPCCVDKINDPDCIHCNLATGECCDKIVSRVQQALGPEDSPMPPQDPIPYGGLSRPIQRLCNKFCTMNQINGKMNDPGCVLCNNWKLGGDLPFAKKHPLPPTRIPNGGGQSFRQIVPTPPCCKATTLPGCRSCSASAPECC